MSFFILLPFIIDFFHHHNNYSNPDAKDSYNRQQ
jgi:hypothetical protein